MLENILSSDIGLTLLSFTDLNFVTVIFAKTMKSLTALSICIWRYVGVRLWFRIIVNIILTIRYLFITDNLLPNNTIRKYFYPVINSHIIGHVCSELFIIIFELFLAD